MTQAVLNTQLLCRIHIDTIIGNTKMKVVAGCDPRFANITDQLSG